MSQRAGTGHKPMGSREGPGLMGEMRPFRPRTIGNLPDAKPDAAPGGVLSCLGRFKCASSGSRSPQLGVVDVWFLQLGEARRDSIAVDQIRPRPPLTMFYIDGQKIEGQPSRAP